MLFIILDEKFINGCEHVCDELTKLINDPNEKLLDQPDFYSDAQLN
jgi:hypothetical protein